MDGTQRPEAHWNSPGAHVGSVNKNSKCIIMSQFNCHEVSIIYTISSICKWAQTNNPLWENQGNVSLMSTSQTIWKMSQDQWLITLVLWNSYLSKSFEILGSCALPILTRTVLVFIRVVQTIIIAITDPSFGNTPLVITREVPLVRTSGYRWLGRGVWDTCAHIGSCVTKK